MDREIYNVPLLKQIALAVEIIEVMQRHYLSLLPCSVTN